MKSILTPKSEAKGRPEGLCQVLQRGARGARGARGGAVPGRAGARPLTVAVLVLCLWRLRVTSADRCGSLSVAASTLHVSSFLCQVATPTRVPGGATGSLGFVSSLSIIEGPGGASRDVSKQPVQAATRK